MPSRDHQLLCGLIARSMRERGYEIVCFDGDESLIGNAGLLIPPQIRRHRPDLLGVNHKNAHICIGEAKTASDLSSARTREQFYDYSQIFTHQSNHYCEFIIGIPKSSEPALLRLLDSLGIANNSNVFYVWIPDEFLQKGHHGV